MINLEIMKSLSHKVGFNTLIQAVGKIVSLASSFILVAFLTRYLGTSVYGEYTTIFVYAGLFAIVGEFGLDQFLIKELSKKSGKADRETFLNDVLGLRLLLVTISLILAVLTSFIISYSKIVRWGIFVASISSYFFYTWSILMSYFQAKLNFLYPVVSDVLGKIFVSLISILSILVFKSGLLILIIISLLGSVLSFFILYSLFLREKILLRFVFNFARWKKMFFFTLPIAIVSLLNQVFFRIDVPLLSVISGSEAVGIYGLAFRIHDFLAIPSTLFVASVFPVLASQIKNKRLFSRTLKWRAVSLFFGGLILSLLAIPLSPFAIEILGGKQFTSSVLPLRILILSLAFFYVSDLFKVTMITIEKQKQLFLVYFLAVIFSIFLNLIFIPKYSYLAASWVALVSRIFLVLGMGSLIIKHQCRYGAQKT